MSARLEIFHDHIIGCRVSIEMPHRSQKAVGNPPDVHIVIRVPGKEIVVSHELKHDGHKKAATDAYAVLDEAFGVAQHQLKDYRRISHGDVKHKNGQPRKAKLSIAASSSPRSRAPFAADEWRHRASG